MPLVSKNPATGEILATFEPLSPEQVEKKLQAAAAAFRRYRSSSFASRSEMMEHAANLLLERKKELGALITAEMGKPIGAAVAEVEKCARVCTFYAENAQSYLRDEEIRTEAARSFIRYEPLGPVLAVMPWNFPFWQVFRFAAPALMAGNVALLKHASNVPQSALAIERIFADAGFEEGVFQTLLIGSDAVGGVIEDDRVRATTLTGSEPAGRDVAGRSGRSLKKTVLELGGSDPFIITPSANIEEAVKIGVKARIVNNGQSCIAAKRFIMVGEVADEFERRFVEAMRALRVGNPADESTDVGPLATDKIITDLEEQVRQTVAKGATVLLGGGRLTDLGPNYFAPTVLKDIPEGSPAFQDETFGPVAALFRVADVDQAITLANSTTFGLGASAWTNDPEEQRRFIEGIESGQVFINAMVASDPRLPFGGVKNSGYGRELSAAGIREFVNIKTVWVGKSDTRRVE
jgi:succinate-semialdehyde dehydrogenase/glutarate-semialdehyde dehydrogenase